MDRLKVVLCTALISLAAVTWGKKPVFHFNANGKFKIMQVTDTHIVAQSEYAQSTVEMLNEVLDAEKPDLVIFTGDIVTGKPYRAGFDIVTAPVIERKIQWAAVFGNHDEEQDLTRAQLAELIQKWPYNVGDMRKKKNVSGYGNYTLEIKASGGKQTKAVLYCLDSNAYSTLQPAVEGYGWIAFDQIAWYRTQSWKFTKANGGTAVPSLAFFHIPLPEYKAVYMFDGFSKIGSQSELVCAPDLNSGMFVSMLEMGDMMGVFVGHDHINDYIFNCFGIALAYGRWSGNKATYGDVKNGVRLIELTEDVRGFDTWLRLSSDITLNQVHFPQDLPMRKKQ